MEKIVVLDLDGTLLKKDKSVSQYSINTLLKFKENGNKILFATARPPRDSYKYVPIELRDNPIICYNGACILQNDTLIYKKQLSKNVSLEIMKKARSFGYNQISIEIDDALYSNFDTSTFFKGAKNKIVTLENINFDKAYKVLICSDIPISQDLLRELPNSCKGTITDNGRLCQIVNSEASKWNSVKSLSDKLNIDTKNIIAFGNDYNDLDMIKNAGIGVAMQNAGDDIKQAADFVTDSNNDDGVAKYIEKNLLVFEKAL